MSFKPTRARFVVVVEFIPFVMTPELQERFLKWRERISVENAELFDALRACSAKEHVQNPHNDRVIKGTPGRWHATTVFGPSSLGNLAFDYPKILTLSEADLEFLGSSNEFNLEESDAERDLIASHFWCDIIEAGIFEGFDVEVWRQYPDHCEFLYRVVDGIAPM